MLSLTADAVVVPLASEDDARATSRALTEYVDGGTRVVAVHVIEKAGGAPDKASVEQREDNAEEVFAAVRQHLDGFDVETHVRYGTDVTDAILGAADDVDADVIAFSPREASRLSRILSGDVALALITRTDRPVLVLPTADSDVEA